MEIAIYGAGGFAREVAWLAEDCNSSESPIKIVGFIDDNPSNHGMIVNEIPVMSLDEVVHNYPNAKVISAIGSPTAREMTTKKALAAGLEIGQLIHPRVERSRWIVYGIGTVICAGSILTTNIRIGNHVQINLDCTIGHDAVIDDYATLAPGAHISGCVHLGKRVYVGTGAVVINGSLHEPLVVEDDVVIGAGACVTKNVLSGLTVVGVPAKPLQRG